MEQQLVRSPSTIKENEETECPKVRHSEGTPQCCINVSPTGEGCYERRNSLDSRLGASDAEADSGVADSFESFEDLRSRWKALRNSLWSSFCVGLKDMTTRATQIPAITKEPK